jgi:Protein of unknown function (DUF3040)
VPLSEHEQRLLEQMERALYAEDPKFASALRGSDLRGRYRRRALLGVFGVVVGLALLPIGIAAKVFPVSVLGFLVMLGSAIWAVSSWRRVPAPGDLGIAGSTATATRSGRAGRAGRAGRSGRAGKSKGTKNKGPKLGYMERLEERWRRRRDQNGG